jgi:hypothetical protein
MPRVPVHPLRGSPLRAHAAGAADATATANPAAASLGRCHPMVSVATPTDAANSAPTSAATPRTLMGATSSATRASDITRVA